MKLFAVVSPAALLFLALFANSSQTLGQDGSIYRLPAGTRIFVRLDAELSSRSASPGDTFTTVVSRPVVVRETTVLAPGVTVEGRVVSVKRAGGFSRNGDLSVVFEWLVIGRDRRRIEGRMLSTVLSKRESQFTVLSILSGAAVGVAVGATGKSPAAAILGAGAGAGGGAIIAATRRGSEAKLGKNVEFEIELTREVTLPVLDY